jgi:cell division protein FtsX
MDMSAFEVDVALLREAGDDESADIAAELINDIRNRATQPLKVSLFLLADVDNATIDAISARLDDEPGVGSYEFVTSKQAYDEFVELWRDQSEFYEGLSQDALPSTFRITTEAGTDADELADRLGELEGVDEVRAEGRASAILAAIGPAMEVCNLQLPGAVPSDL